MPIDRDDRDEEPDLVSTLAARVHAIEDLVQTTSQVVDEKTLKELRRTIEALAKRDPKFEERVTNTVGILADRVETVAKTVSTASASVAAKDGELAQLRRELEAGLVRVSTAVVESNRGSDSSELVEIRRALDDLSKVTKQKMPRGLESRVDELAAKFELVAQRVDSVSSTVSTTAAGLAGRDGDLNALRRAVEAESDRVSAELAEVRRGVDPAAMADLRQSLKELADETARRLHGIQNLIGQVGAKVDALAQNVESLSTSLESTTSRVAATEEGLSAFRSYFEDAGGRLSTLLAQHNELLGMLSERADALERADAQAARTVEERIVEVSGKLDDLGGRLESSEQASAEAARLLEDRIASASDRIEDVVGRLEPLGEAMSSVTERLDAGDGDLLALERRFQEGSDRVEALVAELSRALGELPDPDSIERALAARFDELAGRTTLLGDGLARVETSMREQVRSSTSSTADVERLHELLAELGARTVALEQADEVTAHEHDERLRDLNRKLDDVGRRLESSAATTAAADARVSKNEDEVSAVREYVEKAGTRLTSLLAEHAHALAAVSARTESLEQADSDAMSVLDQRISVTVDRIDELSNRLAPLVAQASDDLAGRIDGLAAKLQATHEEHAENASEIARIAAILEVERASLRTKLESLAVTLEHEAGAPGTEELERRVDTLMARVEASDGERASVQAQFEAIAKALASIPRHSSFERRLDELGGRLNEVEQRGAAVASKVSHASALLPTALRSLEARLDEVSPGSRKAPPEADAPVEQTAEHEPEATEAVEIVERERATVVPLRVSDP